MKRIVSLFLIGLLLLTLFISCDTEDSTTTEKAIDEGYFQKIHVYMGDSEYSTIDSREELESALKDVNKYFSEMIEIDYCEISVSFASDLMNTEKYKEFMRERDRLGTIESVRNWRQRLNTYSKEYHEQIVNDNKESLLILGYTEFNHTEYSPLVFMSVPLKNLSSDVFTELILNDSITSICLLDPLSEEVDEEIGEDCQTD